MCLGTGTAFRGLNSLSQGIYCIGGSSPPLLPVLMRSRRAYAHIAAVPPQYVTTPISHHLKLLLGARSFFRCLPFVLCTLEHQSENLPENRPNCMCSQQTDSIGVYVDHVSA